MLKDVKRFMIDHSKTECWQASVHAYTPGGVQRGRLPGPSCFRKPKCQLQNSKMSLCQAHDALSWQLLMNAK